MVSRTRWAKAQAYEKSFWQNTADAIIANAQNQLTWYGWKAEQLERKMQNYLAPVKKDSANILEIGSGPVGIVGFLGWGLKYAVDPLERFYAKNAALIQLRNQGVRYLNGLGEELPFNNGFFSLVIMDNVIDHTHQPLKVLCEAHRVLQDNGLLYFTANTHTSWGAFLHSILSFLHIDKGHPYTFSHTGIRRFLDKGQFTILYEDLEEYKQVKRKNCASAQLKDRLKGYSGLSETLYTAICIKQ